MSSNNLNVHRGSDSEYQRPGKRYRSNSCQRRPLSELSPNALSPPIAIPRISINYHGTTTNFEETNNDDVFDISSSNKENFHFSPQHSRILFPSYGTSPSQALNIEEETSAMFRSFASNIVDDVKKLGKGSFGTVILGYWKSERVAVKIIKQRTSLTNELNALKLHHENVTKIKHVIEETESDNEQNHGIIVMEYVGQNNLQALIEKNDLSVTLIKSFLIQIAKGLNHCHIHLTAHLDLKPSNILVTSTGQCKLADFGCSIRFKTAHENRYVELSPGTPGYQAPELFTMKKINLKSDIFSFGILIWQVIVKESQPYPGWHPHAIIYKVTAQDIRPNKEPPSIWNKYQSLYKSCWSSKAENRPTAREALRTLMTLDKKSGSGSSLLKASNTSSRSSSGLRL